MFITLSALVLVRNGNILPNMEMPISYMEKRWDTLPDVDV